jgi:predicted exporter
MMRSKGVALSIWLIAAVLCVIIVTRTPIRTDMGAFLPHSSSLAQQTLTDQVNNGTASRLILVAVQGAPTQALAALSKTMATRLRASPAFIDVLNGDAGSFAGVQHFVWQNRYLLGADVRADRFTVAGLHAALQADLGLLGSDIGDMIKPSLPGDPTGEVLTLTQQLQGSSGPRTEHGVWVSPHGRRALLLVHTRAPGFEIDSQQHDLALIHAAFDAARHAMPGAHAAQLLETGPGVFAVRIRDATKHDVTRLSLLATIGAACILLFAYRSPRVLLLGLLPVASGALAAIAAVSLDFGFVHGVTLGFGVTLIGESLDYAIYLFTQTARGEQPADTLARIWPTLRLGALTSVVGFSAMLFSSFVGFAQLGLFSIVGLIVAACVTRFILPHLVPRGFFAPGAGVLATPLLAVIRNRAKLRWLIGCAVLASLAILLVHRGHLLDENLMDLSPIPPAAQTLDKTLRRDIGVQDLRYFVVFRATDPQRALRDSAALSPLLQALVASHHLTGFDLPTMILPSVATQQQRQDALPDAPVLQARLTAALTGLPFRADTFAPFLRAAAATKAAKPLTPASLPPALALRLHAMLVPSGKNWSVIAPLHGVTDAKTVAAAIAAAGLPGATFVDLHHESNALLGTFQREATLLALIGSVAILVVLLVGLRSLARVAVIAAPLAAAVVVTAGLLTLGGGGLSIFMIVGFLLIVAVGSNYCLFFERSEPDPAMRRQAVSSVVLANLCTVSAYGLMAFSQLPVLHDIGATVAIGTALSLIFAAVLSTGRQA